jgi:long-subunit fatty acid transport protein
MRNAKRGRGSHGRIYLSTVAVLGLTFAACGGSGSSSIASASQADSPLPAASGAVTINWMPPTVNTNGTSVANLAGYDIHYGTASGDYTQTIFVPNPGIATYVVDNLAPGTYYFAVGAVNSDGTESPLSAEVTATVN